MLYYTIWYSFFEVFQAEHSLCVWIDTDFQLLMIVDIDMTLFYSASACCDRLIE